MYALASQNHSSGFFPVGENENLANFSCCKKPYIFHGLNPNFEHHDRYFLFAEVVNNTSQHEWVLHISNFGFKNPKVRVINAEHAADQFTPVVKDLSAEINTIGRASTITLEPGVSYFLLVELRADNVVWHPYIGLMSEEYYDGWKTRMDFAYKLAIGIILGLILIAFMCWLLMSEKVFLWGGLSSLLMLFYYLEHSSLPAIFWQSTYEKTFLIWLLITSTLMSQTLFAAAFLQLNQKDKIWYRFYVAALASSVAVLLASYFLSFRTASILFALNYLVVWGFILFSGIARLRSHGRFYVLYICGWLPIVLSIFHVIYVLLFPQQTDHVEVSYKLIHVLYVQILHMVIHATALISRVKSMRDEKAHAEYLSQAKSRFIAQSSHDLRQPLSSMNLFLEYLYPHIQGEKALTIFEHLKKAQQHMQDSFNNMLDMSRLEAGALNVNMRAVSMEQLFIKLQHEFQVLARAKPIALHVHMSSAWVLSDPALLERILRNLLANAIHYTREGKVVLGCRRKKGQLIVQVLDTGCGIDPESQNEIFDIYKRSTEQQSHSAGIGVGLSIVKQICDLLGHSLNLTSHPGKGSQFSITVPLAEGHTAGKAGDNLLPGLEAPSVLLLIENDEIRNGIADHFTKWGCAVATVESRVAINQIASEASGEKVFILLCDYPCASRELFSQKYALDLEKKFIAACLCEADENLPENWITLSTALPPAQLRALLNLAYRRLNSVMTE